MSELLIIGRPYTMSVMKHPCGDRSYLEKIWEILAVNETHAVIKAIHGYPEFFGKEPLVVCISEFDWFPADDLMKALVNHSSPDTKKFTGVK